MHELNTTTTKKVYPQTNKNVYQVPFMFVWGFFAPFFWS